MARMSHDDSVGRDSRFDHLAMLVGWSKRETVGCLQLDVWPICYDRITPYLTVLDIDLAANRMAISPVKHPGGFTGAMIEARLARPATKHDTSFTWQPKGWKEGDPEYTVNWPDQDWRGKIYLNGTAERIAYLMRSKLAGSLGGRKSAETRAKKNQPPLNPPTYPPTKGPARGQPQGVEGSTNLPDTPTAPVPDSASAPVPATASPPDPQSTERVPAARGDDRLYPPSGSNTSRHSNPEHPKRERKPKAPKLKPVPAQEAIDAAKALMARIIGNQPNCSHARAGEAAREATVLRWADTMRLLHERDSRSWEEIHAMVAWCQDHEFWRANILSADTLRAQWDKLDAQRNRDRARGSDWTEGGRYGRGRIMSGDEVEEDRAALERDYPGLAGK